MISIDLNTPLKILESYLTKKSWLLLNEHIQSIESPGEGNMNVVLRVKTDKSSFIIKQSRPFVQKYPSISAPLNRIAIEYQFYKKVINPQIRVHLPRVIHFDPKDHLLMMEDLGKVQDLTRIYDIRKISPTTFNLLLEVLTLIHQTKNTNDFPENLSMRMLNHQHIFELPFMLENGFSLDDIQPGLQKLSLKYKNDKVLKATVQKIGALYLSEGTTLLHGDYYPGSWMQTANNTYVLDPEFAFVGFPEYDLGVMAGHLIMATHDETYLEKIIIGYEGKIREQLLLQMAGIEIIRRLIGLAQLPMQRTLDEKEKLLQIAYNLIKS
ncbi:phosphotransferase [Maribacter sp. CXY002]|uniref:phosphotransferase n=1 Tax=Maribacter luteocoastalis TaxID=3407671 RepID=UPI003B6789CF